MFTRTYSLVSSFLPLVPVAGSGLFLALFIRATYLYPGGSQADKLAAGFSWQHNYWCNLLNIYAMNGQLNPARPVAITALIILCFSLALFWYCVPGLLTVSRREARLIQVAGATSMGLALFIFTDYHDAALNAAGFFACVALAGTFVGLYRSRLMRLFWLGAGCLLLLALNNFIYYTNHWLHLLPVVQKITFAVVLGWVVLLTISVYTKQQAALSIAGNFKQ